MIYTPRDYQSLIANFAIDHDRCNVFASPGTGKTSSLYLVASYLKAMGEAKRILVLGPKRVAKNVWPAERAKWLETFGHLSVAAAIGTADQRLAAVRSKPDMLCINYENIEWLVDGYGSNWPFDLVIADESSKIKGLRIQMTASNNPKGQGAVRAKKLAAVAHKHTRRWVNLTGSPAPNGLQDLWGQQFFVDGGRRLGNSFAAFEHRWFYSHNTPDGYTKLVPHKWSQAEIEGLMRDCSITIDAKDYFDIKEPIERNFFVDLPPAARQAYMTMEKELFAQIEEHPVEVFSNSGKSQKCLQIASGSVYVDDKRNWTRVHDEKIDMLKSIVDEFNGEPILVRYVYRPDLERILKAFPRARFLDDKQSTEDAWNRGDIPILVTHGASAGHGLSLQHGGRVLVDYSSDMNLEHDEQIIERLGPTRQAQSGYDRAVYRCRIIARDTLEENVVLPVLKRKMGVQEAFKAAMKIRR